MNPTDLAMLAVLAALVSLIVVEFVRPARQFEKVPRWRLKGFFFIFVMFAIGGVLPVVVGSLLGDFKLLPGDELGVAGGAVVGIVVMEFFVYWLHRLHHRVDFLWRWVHQLHHSAERMDIFGSAYFHPFEMIESGLFSVLVGNLLLGLSPEAAGLVGAWMAFNGFWQHGNIRTPRWLGYFIQRPEQHGIHHEREIHALNYANLPLWDIVFGTFKNPETWDAPCGFYPGSSQKLGAMLVGRDVSNEQAARTRDTEEKNALPAPQTA